MTIWGKIKEIISGVAYGSIDQQLNQREKRAYGFVGLIIAVAAQVALAWWLIPIDQKALLNIVIFPFQLIGIFSLMYIVQGVTKYPYDEGSFWNIKTEKYIPFFIRTHAFIYQPYVVVFVIKILLENYMNYMTNLELKSMIFWFIISNGSVIFIFIVARWLKIFLEKFERAVKSIKHLLQNELEFKTIERSIRNEVFNHKEIVFILIAFSLGKLNDVVLNPDQTWFGGGFHEYNFPLTNIHINIIWNSFSNYTVGWFLIMVFGSVAYVYIRIDSVLKMLKTQRLNIFLFHPDGYAGLGKISDFIFSFLTKILLLISIITFVTFLGLQFELPVFSWDEVPGNDSPKLTKFLMQKYDANWIKTAKIQKIDDGMAIKISAEKNFILLRLNEEKTKVSLTIDDGRTEEFSVKKEKGRLNIYDPWSPWRKFLITGVIILDSFALIIFFYPLMEMRSIIKRKKEEERQLLLERIKQKEETYLEKSLTSEDFQEIENTFNLIKHIEAVSEWGIGSRQLFSLLGRLLLTFNGIVLQIVINYARV